MPDDATRAPGEPEERGESLAGETFGGYVIEREIAHGGMGVVYRARDAALGRDVALKVIAPQLGADRVFRERFRRESRLAAQVEHPAVVPVYRAGQDQGRLFIAMRLIEGTDLATVLRERRVLTPSEAIELIAQVAGALDAAHTRGLVHRDVKPANVLLSEDAQRAFLTDFGLTIELDQDAGLTRTGTWVGTLAYAAPEQLRGGEVDARTDVYALGGVLHHCVTGQVPYPVTHQLDAVSAHLFDPPPRPSAVDPELPRALDRVVARAMSKDPEARYPSAGDLANAAAAAVRGDPAPRQEQSVATGAAAPRATAPPAPRSRRARRIWIAGVAAAALAAAGVTIVALSGGDGRGAEEAQPPAGRPIALEIEPDYVTVHDGRVWTLAREVGRLVRVDPRTRQTTEFAPAVDLGGGSYGGLTSGAGMIWVAHDSQDGGVDGVDPQTGAGTRHVPLPNVKTVAFGRNSVWALSAARGKGVVVRLDPRDGHQVGRRFEAGEDPVALEFGDGSLWVANRRPGALTRIDPSSGRATVIEVGPRPSAIAVGAAGVWVLNDGDDTLTRVDPSANQPVGAPLSLGKQLEDVALAGRYLWVAAADETVSQLDPETGKTSGSLGSLGRPSLALAPDGEGVWVASAGDHTVRRLAPQRS
jgi:streptogramin lyase